MKNQKLRLVLASLSLLAATVAAEARSPEQSYIESFQGRSDIPVPVTVVSPSISPRYAGTQVELEFVVDASGTPAEIRTRQKVDAALSTALAQAVSQWRFAPAPKDGVAVPTKVVLPLRIELPEQSHFAMN